jgi:multicomponent Na+:H+ antiporter subunit G
MPEALHLLGGGLVALGAVSALVGAAGVWRFPDVYTRLHAASITDTAAATLVLVGLGLISGWSLPSLKLAICWALLMIAGPTASHAVAAAAYSAGVWPWRQAGEAEAAGEAEEHVK